MWKAFFITFKKLSLKQNFQQESPTLQIKVIIQLSIVADMWMSTCNDNLKKGLLTADTLWLFGSINQILVHRIYFVKV